MFYSDKKTDIAIKNSDISTLHYPCEVDGKIDSATASEKKSRKKSIRVELSIEDYNQFRQMAEKKRVTLRHLAMTKMLDTSEGLQEYKNQLAILMPEIHHLIDQMEDQELQEMLRKKVGEAFANL